MSDDDIHEMLKKLFNFFDAYNPLTKRVERFGRTAMSADSTTERAMEFIDKIGVWLGEEYKTPLPDAEEYKKIRDGAPLINETNEN